MFLPLYISFLRKLLSQHTIEKPAKDNEIERIDSKSLPFFIIYKLLNKNSPIKLISHIEYCYIMSKAKVEFMKI